MAEILGKKLDLYDDSIVAEKPFNLAESEITGPRFLTGADLERSTRISAEWKDPVAIPAQASTPYAKAVQPLVVGLRAAVDSVANIFPNLANTIAQTSLEVVDGGKKEKTLLQEIGSSDEISVAIDPLIKILGVGLWASDIDRKELMERAKTYDEAITLLENRDYPSHKFAKRIIADTTSNVETRNMVRELYRQAGNIDSSKWYNKAGEIIGAMAPALYVGKTAFGLSRAFGAGRLAATRIAQNIAKGYIGVEMGGQYAEETAEQYLQRTGDKTFKDFTAQDATGITAMAYGAIGAQIEMMGGVEPIFAGALSKVGLKSGLLKAGAKIGIGEATEELLQGLTETLMRKIDGSSTKTWREGFLDSLNSAAWGLFIGGSLGTVAFHTGRANLVKGIKQSLPNITNEQATQIANAMIENTAEISSQDPTLRSNLREKVALMYRDIDIENKENIIDATTDLEYGIIAMDSAERGINIAENPIFSGVVNELGWFRNGIPENRREEVQAINDEIKGLKEQLAEEQKKEEKDWDKIDELESKLTKVNEYVLDKLADLVRNDAMAVRRMLHETEQKFVNKEKKRAKKKTKQPKEIFAALPDEKFDVKADHTNPYNYTRDGDSFSYYDDGNHHIIELLDNAGNIISSIEINKSNKGINYIQTFDKENWRKGYGTKVLKEAERLFGDNLVAKPSPDEWAQGFWKKNQYTEKTEKGLLKKPAVVEVEEEEIKTTEPTEEEEKEAIKEAEDVKDGTITSGTPENTTENIIQDYGERIEGAKKDMGLNTEKSTKPEKTSINKIMEKAPQHEEERKVLEDWLQKQDSEFVENIRQLNLPIKVWKTENYKRQLEKAYEENPNLKQEKGLFDVIYGWDELSSETLEKLGITPEYRFVFVFKKNFFKELTPENVADYISGRSVIKFIYQKSTNGNFYLWGKKGNNGSWLPLINFETKEDMDAHKASHEQADLEKIYNEMTTYKPTAEKVIRERVGADYRQGKNITEKEFADKFDFRGIQFGNYEKNEKRQKEINNSYDSFLDLTNILNLPPKAISLGGTLGIAFGARGSGSASAHYEPDLKVINITRDAGAGALAHEWFHALDNYLAQNLSQYANMAGGGFITKSDNYYYYKVNQELADALKEYIRAIKGEKDFQLRLRQLGQYWKRDWEVGARLFEQYVSSKIALQNGINDYLANPQDYYTSATPYLTEEEASRVFPKLENMLNSIKTREEDGNVILYQEQFDLAEENARLDDIYWQNRASGAAPSTYRGAYIPTYRFILRANRMDASSLSHELAHDWFEVNFDRYRSGEATEDFMRAWGALEKALGIEENAKVAPRKASETFARAYEAWITDKQDWTTIINVDDKDKDAIENLLKDYQGELRNIYNDINNKYFKETWGKLGELKPELKAWFDRAVNITDLDRLVERGEMTEAQATQEKLNRAIDTVIETTTDEETANALRATRLLNDTSRYEVEGGNKNSLQNRLADLAREIDENNMLLKEKYNTHRDMMQVAEAADNFVKTRLDDALAIINGQMAEVEGLYKEDIYTALERLALENGDLDLLDELKNSEIANRLAKELGQRVAGFRNWKQSTDIDVLSMIKATDNRFNKALENKKAKQQFNSALDLLDESLENQDKQADKDLDSILNDLECK